MRFGWVGAAAAVLIASSGCGQADLAPEAASSAPAPSAAHSAADVAFARDMIPHHQQALVLAAMVPSRSANAELRVIATQIGADQKAEILTLQQLLTDWGEPAEAHQHHGDQMVMPMKGMVDQVTLDRLSTLSDGAFDDLWITSMIGHHQGAIDMSENEVTGGTSPEAIHVARLIIDAQQREISRMNHLISATQ